MSGDFDELFEQLRVERLTHVRPVEVEPATHHKDEIGLFEIRLHSSSNMTTVLDMNMLELINLRNTLSEFIETH